jgi:glycosyltransferase involved in cell wall biosynthesis
MSRPRIALLRGHHANVWDLRPWELLLDEFDVSVLVTGSNLHQTEGLELALVDVRTPRDLLPAGRAAGAAAYLIGERYLDLAGALTGADLVHGAEIGTWYTAQAAGLKQQLGYSLVATVWETIPWREAYRWPRERAYRRRALAAIDHFLPTTEKARDALVLEGVPGSRCTVSPPGIDLARFARGEPSPPPGGRHRVLSAGRLVWEKGHQDVLRAVASLRQGMTGPPREDVELLVVGSGPEEQRLRRYASELGLDSAVEFRATVPYDEMPGIYASASALVLASLPTRGWEEQFGMVLVEALAARTPVIAACSGAIPEVLAGRGALFAPGDWAGLARALANGPLAGSPGERAPLEAHSLERFSTEACAERLRSAYRALLSARTSSARS